MKIKVLSTMLALCLCALSLSLLSSCAGSGSKPVSPSPSPDSEIETDEPPMELAEGDIISYVSINDGKCWAVAGINAENGALRVEIPEKYRGLPVVAISSEAFASSIHLRSIELPNSIKYIGNNAFDGCSNLESINIPESLEHLGPQAFDGCGKLPVTEYNGALYLGSESAPYTVLISAKSTDFDGVCTVHNDTKIIYGAAFDHCTEIDRIIIPNGIRYVGIGAFEKCYELVFATHESVKYLGNESNPYLVCVGVEERSDSVSYTIHEDTRIIAPAAFFECKRLETVNIPNGLKTIGEYAFVDCSGIKRIEFDRISLWAIIDTEDFENTLFVENSEVDTNEMLRDTHKGCVWIRQ